MISLSVELPPGGGGRGEKKVKFMLAICPSACYNVQWSMDKKGWSSGSAAGTGGRDKPHEHLYN